MNLKNAIVIEDLHIPTGDRVVARLAPTVPYTALCRFVSNLRLFGVLPSVYRESATINRVEIRLPINCD